MAYSKDKITEVRKLYVLERQSLEIASQLAGVSYGTAQRWKNSAKEMGEDWDKLRTAHTMKSNDMEELGIKILNNLVTVFDSSMAQMEKNPDMDAEMKVKLLASMADSYVKSTSAIQKSMPSVSKLAVAMLTMELFSKHIQQHKPELLAEFVNLIDSFGEVLDKELK